MVWEKISIRRMLPVIDNYVQIPDNLEKNKKLVSLAAFLAATPGASVVKLMGQTGGARSAGPKHGVQEMVAIPDVLLDCCHEVPPTMENVKNTFNTTNRTPQDGEEGCECIEEMYRTYLSITFDGTQIPSFVCGCRGNFITDTTYILPNSYYYDQGGQCVWWVANKEGYTITVVFNPAECNYCMTITCLPNYDVVWQGCTTPSQGDGKYGKTPYPTGTYYPNYGNCGDQYINTATVSFYSPG